MNGIVVIDKPKGVTSHDVVGMMRKRFGTRRVGHTGTLDPMATGVLPVCIGNATRAADMLIESDKRYTAEFILGKTTDTLDIEGTVTGETDVTVTEDEVRRAVLQFMGEISQIPPMYSAIKKDGKKLYELAREGKEIEREARNITVYSIDILRIDLPTVEIDVKCSKGTYIRTLCDDIGKALGCGATMTALRRTATAGFTEDNALTIDELDKLEDKGAVLVPTDKLFEKYRALHLNEKQTRSITNGVQMTWRDGYEGERVRLYSNEGKFLCVSQIKDMKLILIKSFWS